MADRRAATAFIAGALCALPLVTGLVVVAGRDWVPIGDEALILQRVRGVGTGESPVLGVYSVRGWAHPGPALFYLLAGPFRLFGSQDISLFQAASVLNLFGLGLLMYLGWRRRRAAGSILLASVVSTLIVGLGVEILVQPWNPYVPLLMYLAFLLGIWSLLEGDWPVLPVTVGLAVVIVQMHVGYLPLTVAGLGFAALGPLLGRSDARGLPDRRTTLSAAAVAAFLCLPVLVDLAAGDANLVTLLRYFADGEHQPVGLRTAIEMLSQHTRPTGPWSGGAERLVVDRVDAASSLWLAAFAGLLAWAALAALRRGLVVWRLPALALVQLGTGLVAASRVEVPLLSYLIVWMLPLAAFCWFALLTAAVEVARGRLGRVDELRPLLPRFAAAGGLLLGLVVLVQSVRSTVEATDLDLPRQRHAPAVLSLLTQLRDDWAGWDGRVRVEGVGDSHNEAWVGVLHAMGEEGLDFVTGDGAAGQKWGTDHTLTAQPVDTVLTIATYRPGTADTVAACEADPSVVRIASWDLLDAGERTQLMALRRENYLSGGNLDPHDHRLLARLEPRAYRIAVFEGDHVCGGG